MGYKYYSRTAKRKAKKSSRNFIITLSLIGILIYATLQWILPSVIGGVGLINAFIKPSQKVIQTNYESLAPPVITIPFEATNSAQINISGYAAPNSKVELFVDDEKKDTTQTPEDGRFEFTNITLSLGTNNIYGKTVDEKNVESLPSKTLTVSYDSDKPTLTVSEPEDGKIVQGGDKKISFKGRTDADVKVYINGVQAITGLDGSFSNDQSLNDGDNNFTIKAVSKAGNETETSRKITYKP